TLPARAINRQAGRAAWAWNATALRPAELVLPESCRVARVSTLLESSLPCLDEDPRRKGSTRWAKTANGRETRRELLQRLRPDGPNAPRQYTSVHVSSAKQNKGGVSGRPQRETPSVIHQSGWCSPLLYSRRSSRSLRSCIGSSNAVRAFDDSAEAVGRC